MAQASVTLKVSASNPSEFQEQTVPIKSYLPKGIRPENVLDTGGLEVGYDVKKGQCYVRKEVVLPAKGSVSYNVVIDDIWLVDEEDLERQRNYTYKLRDQLLRSDYAGTAKAVAGEIEAGIQSVLDKQEENLVEKVTPVEHIGAYELNQETIAQIKESIGVLESLVIALVKGGTSSAGGGKTLARGQSLIQKLKNESLLGRGKSPAGVLEPPARDAPRDAGALNQQFGDMRAGSCLSQEAVRYANAQNVSLETPENVKLDVVAQNPSQTESQTLPVRYYLSEDVRVNDVIDPGGLDVGFDFEKSFYYVYKDNVLLQPGEKKIFSVVLRNKWSLDKFYLFTLKVHSDNVSLALESRHFVPKQGPGTLRQKNDEIQSQLDQLLQARAVTELTEDYVAAFRTGQQRLNNVEEEIRKLEDMLVASGALETMTPESKERLCEEERDKRTIERAKGSGAVKEFKIAASTMFKGKSPNRSTTWQLISGIVIFLGLISGSFYYLQVKEQKSAMLDTLTGVFSRGYITERFREELNIAQNTRTKCSLLILDVDKFKAINDKYGHAIGDTILKEFVIAIRKGVRATDMAGRFGGDEFLIILPTGDKERARKIAEGIVRIVERNSININQQLFNITTSIGVATYPDDSRTAEDMFKKADGALYMVKRKGGNGVAVV
ncbi:MAG: GGDEF domain-containing protein [Candidatus Omnitrophica bacterium]|nr:GGDEF domain-containing protein [Candidatus Omnitrophota bacterium]